MLPRQTKNALVIQLTALIFIVSAGCTLPDSGSEEINVAIEVESFLEKRTIVVRWRADKRAEKYVLNRARDEIGGLGQYEEIYRGQGTKYTDKNVVDDIRYVYRVDTVQKGIVYKGKHTGIGVGSNADIDMNEPNNRKEEATALGSSKRGTMYYFRFSDRRELEDVDWYKVKVSGHTVVYLRVREDGVMEGKITTLLMRLEGNESFPVEQGKWYKLQNEAETEKELYIEIRADKESYVATGMTGGMVRGYEITKSNVESWDPPELPGENGNGNGTGNPGTPGTGEGATIEEKSELFEASVTGWITFFLNEKKYQNRNYTFWKHLEQEWVAEQGMTIDMVKESGNYLGGYGFFFAGGNVKGYGETMLVLLIQKDGNYAIGKAIGGRYEAIAQWKNSLYLRKGYGVRNTVEVRWDNARNEYILIINGVEERRFIDAHEPVCAGSKTGLVAVVTNMEQFPQTPVKVWFK